VCRVLRYEDSAHVAIERAHFAASGATGAAGAPVGATDADETAKETAPRPETGRDCPICAEDPRQRKLDRLVAAHTHFAAAAGAPVGATDAGAPVGATDETAEETAPTAEATAPTTGATPPAAACTAAPTAVPAAEMGSHLRLIDFCITQL